MASKKDPDRLRAELLEVLRLMPYEAYLRTDHWDAVRQAALKRAGGTCQLCDAAGALQIHHRHYRTRGCERPEDVIALCPFCHEKFHAPPEGPR